MTDRQRAALLRAALADYRAALADFKKTREGYVTHPNGPNWQAGLKDFDKGTEKANRLLKDLQPPPIPQLGPVLEDGLAMNLHAPTHRTDDIPVEKGIYIAFDTGFNQTGRWTIAPEELTVTAQSGAAGGDAFYAVGKSKIKYWVGHIGVAPPTGKKFLKGARIARVGAIPGTDHVHWGLDTRPLTGQGLKWGEDGNGPQYTWGSPTIGAQLTTMMQAI